MLSNKLFSKITLLSILFLLSCSKKDEEKHLLFNYQDENQMLDLVKKHIDEDIQKVLIGYFDQTKSLSTVAIAEKMDSLSWGIKFYHLKQDNSQIKRLFETDVLEGSLHQSRLNKIKLLDFNYELIYYNSESYFMGSNGGEIFSYILDLKEKQIYYAHLVNDIEYPASLFISDNVKDIKLRNFIISNFKINFPNLKIVDRDIALE